MDRPIGIIDSGVGGLTVAYEIMRQLPRENFIYLGDTLRCPYGSRTEKEIEQYTFEMVDFLRDKNIKMLIIACNTATAYTIDKLKQQLDIPVIGVIRPGARTAIKVSETKNIAILGTEATVKSGAYVRALENIHPDIQSVSIACPKFVPIIEKGVFSGEEIEEPVAETLEVLKDSEIDTVILGCTHYPLIKDIIQDVVGEEVKVISSGEETAVEASALLEVYKLLNKTEAEPTYTFYATGDTEIFGKIADHLFHHLMNGKKMLQVQKVKL